MNIQYIFFSSYLLFTKNEKYEEKNGAWSFYTEVK